MDESPDRAEGTCPTCGTWDDPKTPFMRHLCSGMRRVPDEKRIEFGPEAKERLLAFMDEADRCRARAAVEARFAWIG